jgi:hypothetical protein
MKISILVFLCIFSFINFANSNTNDDDGNDDYQAGCDYNISLSNATIQIGSAAQVNQQDFNISRDVGANGRCGEYRIFFSKGLANSYQRNAFSVNGSSLNYNLHQNINMNGILKEKNDALSSTEFITGIMSQPDTNYANNFFISAPSLASLNATSAGTYTDNIQVALYGYNPNSQKYSFARVTTFTVTFIVSKKVDISVVDEGAAYDHSSTSKVLDFGLLEMNAERGADVRVVSNTPYQVQLSSTNNGVLKLGTSTISYQMKSNGANINLLSSQTAPVTIGSGTMTQTTGDRYNLKFKIIEDVDNKSSGLYQDVITITAIAN